MTSRKIYISMAFALTLAPCGNAETPTPITIFETVEVTVAPEATPLAIPFLEQWQDSEHADAGDTSPNFFNDLNADGEPDPDEKRSGNKYQTWTSWHLRAAFNYHTIYQDDGGYAHNGRYFLQLLYDSIEDLHGDVTGANRP